MHIKQKSKLFTVIVSLLSAIFLLTSIPLESVSANNDRSKLIDGLKSKSRYSFVMKDQSASYDVFIHSKNEQIYTEDSSWACAKEGDVSYTGDYSLTLVKKGSNTSRSFSLGKQTFSVNKLTGHAYIASGEPDLLAFSTCQASSSSSVQLFYIHSGKLLKVKNGLFTVNAPGIKGTGSKATYQSIQYNNAERPGYSFVDWKLDLVNRQMKAVATYSYTSDNKKREDGGTIAEEWLRNKSFIVKKDTNASTLLNQYLNTIQYRAKNGYLDSGNIRIGTSYSKFKKYESNFTEVGYHGPYYFKYMNAWYFMDEEFDELHDNSTIALIMMNATQSFTFEQAHKVLGKPASKGMDDYMEYYYETYKVGKFILVLNGGNASSSAKDKIYTFELWPNKPLGN